MSKKTNERPAGVPEDAVPIEPTAVTPVGAPQAGGADQLPTTLEELFIKQYVGAISDNRKMQESIAKANQILGVVDQILTFSTTEDGKSVVVKGKEIVLNLEDEKHKEIYDLLTSVFKR